MLIIENTFVALFGLILGSFFNVLIWRLPRNESVIWPASHCASCRRKLAAWENIPILSFIVLDGRCSGCKAPISRMYPAVEAVTALAAVLLWNTIGLSRSSSWQHDTHLIIQCAALLLTIPIAVIDKQHTIIPDAITIPMLVIALGASLLPGDTTPLQSLLGILSGGGTLYAIGWLGRIVFRKDEAMGGGDIKLLALFGALWGPSDALLSIFFGSLLGTLGAAALVILKKLNKDHMIPFGPFLALGIWTAVLAGEQIISAYMRFMTGLFFR